MFKTMARAAAAAVFLTTMTIPALTAQPALAAPTEGSIVQIAQRELNDGSRNYEIGDNCSFYGGEMFGWPACGGMPGWGGKVNDDVGYNWCSAFAKYVWREGGVTAYLSEIGSFAQSFKDYGQAHGTWHARGTYVPHPGDAVVFDWDHDPQDSYPIDHVGIVESATASTLVTIEGNIGTPGGVRRQTRTNYDSNVDVIGFSTAVGVNDPVVAPDLAGRQLSDLNLDGRPELIGRKTDGTLWVYPHLNTSVIAGTSWGAAVQIGSGWNVFDTVIFEDLNFDARPEIIARKPDGTLLAYPHLNTSVIAGTSWGAAVQIGSGWNVYDLMFVVDVTDDSRPELIGRKTDGTLLAYPHLNTSVIAGTSWGAAVQIGSGWNVYDMVAIDDLGNNGNAAAVGPELIGRKADGTLWAYPHNTSVALAGTSWNPAVQIGSGWQNFTSFLTGDLNADFRTEMVVRDANGLLFAYPHTTSDMIAGSSWSTPVQIGSGWNGYSLLS